MMGAHSSHPQLLRRVAAAGAHTIEMVRTFGRPELGDCGEGEAAVQAGCSASPGFAMAHMHACALLALSSPCTVHLMVICCPPE